MRRQVYSMPLGAILASCILFGTAASADESMSSVTPTKEQMMKDCIEKQKAGDVTMSKSHMKRLCRDQMKRQKAGGTAAETPPTDTPHN